MRRRLRFIIWGATASAILCVLIYYSCGIYRRSGQTLHIRLSPMIQPLFFLEEPLKTRGWWSTDQRIVAHVPVFAVYGMLAGLALSYLTQRRTRPGHCERCGYDLRGSPDHCPECGWVPPNQQLKSTGDSKD